MGMAAGSASLSGTTIVGTDLAYAIATALSPILESSAAAALAAAALPGVSTTLPANSVKAIRQSACDIANGIASSLVPYIQANAVAVVSTANETTIVGQTTPVNLPIQ